MSASHSSESPPPRRSAALGVIVLLVALLLVAGWLGGWFTPRDALVVYCAHDSIFSEEILKEFERQTGIPVVVRFDTEATKTLGLINLLLAEKDNPRCDVFWNNEVLGTMDLKERGVLQPYQGPGYERIPRGLKDPDGYWTGFASRMRVWIVHRDGMPDDLDEIDQAPQGDLSRVAMAKPLYGTTLTHYSVLWHEWGGEELKRWHRDVRQRGLKEADGNAMVKNLVAAGACDLGWTDTDDVFVALDADQPVEMRPVRVEGRTICIPNSVAVIRGTKRLEQAQRLVDFLLSEETELALAASGARQIPLGPVDETKLSSEVRQLKEWAADPYDLAPLGPARAQCLEWLKTEYLQ